MKKRARFNQKSDNIDTKTSSSGYLMAKKSLGQNFLKNKHIIEKIVEASNLVSTDIVVEIGPGAGALTESILQTIRGQKTGKLIAIEKDSRAIALLQEKFNEDIRSGIFELIEGDILETNLQDFTLSKPYTLIGNIPYYITGAIIRKSLEQVHKPTCIVFLVQKEVAERIVCRNTKHSILSQSIAVYGQPELVMTVSKGNFVPVPKVDSAVIRITNISDIQLKQENINDIDFFEILHAGFGHKRKKMYSNILEYIEKKSVNTPKNVLKQALSQIFSNIHISEDIRAEELTTKQWILLVSKISSDIL